VKEHVGSKAKCEGGNIMVGQSVREGGGSSKVKCKGGSKQRQ